MFLKKIDLLSPPITLYSNDELRHSSPFSGILTFITYALIVSFSIYFALDLIERQNPSAFYFNRYVEDAGFFPLNCSSMFNFIQTLDTKTNAPRPTDFNLFRIFGIRDQVELYSSTDRDLSKMEHWLYGNCNNDSDIRGIEHLITMDYFTESACIRKYYDKNEKKYYNTDEPGFIWPSLDKGCSHPNRTFYGIIVERCRNDSLKNDCKSIEEIERYTLTHAIGFQIIDHYADVYNYHEPITKYIYNFQTGIYDDSYTTNHLNFNPIKVKTHNGYLFENQIEELTFYFDQNEKITTNWKTNDEGIYVAFYFWMQNRMQYYERTYERAQNILAKISGMSNSILFIMAILNKLISNYITILDTKNILFKYERKTGNIINRPENNLQRVSKKPICYLDKYEDENKKTSKNDINCEKKECITNNFVDTNGRNINSSEGKNTMSNNYLVNANNKNLIKIINKESEINKQKLLTNEKQHQLFEKNSINFIDYLQYTICHKKKNILIYEEFRRKVFGEEQIVQNYFDICEILSMFESQDGTNKIKGKCGRLRVLS